MSTDTSPDKKRRWRLLFTGLGMGSADLVPGVSGGTVAFLMGIYDELLYTVKLITGRVPRLLLARKFREAWQLIPFGFVLPLGLGIGGAIFGLVHLVEYLLETQPVMVWSLFFGLVLGSAYVVLRRIRAWNWRLAALLSAGFVCTYLLVGLPVLGGSSAPLALFASGAVAITAMILPGISGSLILVLLGQYETVVGAVADRNIGVLVVFALGALVGLALFVRLLSWLLKHHHVAVIAVLVGVMLGSLRKVWPWQIETADHQLVNVAPAAGWGLLAALLLTSIGFGLVLLLERKGLAREHDDIETKAFHQEFTTPR